MPSDLSYPQVPQGGTHSVLETPAQADKGGTGG